MPPPPPQVHHNITYCHNYKVYEGEETYQDEDWGEVCCKVKFHRYGGEHKGGKNQEDCEIGGGLFPFCSGEEEFIISIWICEE